MTVKLIYTQKVLSPTPISLAPYAINPYRGCELGCVYCYGDYLKTRNNVKGSLEVKINAPQILEKELKYRAIKKVVLGTSCECFTYSEAKYRVSEEIISILNRYKVGFDLLTKSHLIKNYQHLFKNNPNCRIFFTLNLHEERIKKLMEKSSPSIQERIKCLHSLKENKISFRIHIGPLIPYLSQVEEIFNIAKGLTTEINVEMYHHKLGNFSLLLQRIEMKDKTIAYKIKEVYSTKSSYQRFILELKKHLKNINQFYKFRIYLIIPEFDNFYTQDIDYAKPFL